MKASQHSHSSCFTRRDTLVSAFSQREGAHLGLSTESLFLLSVQLILQGLLLLLQLRNPFLQLEEQRHVQRGLFLTWFLLQKEQKEVKKYSPSTSPGSTTVSKDGRQTGERGTRKRDLILRADYGHLKHFISCQMLF